MDMNGKEVLSTPIKGTGGWNNWTTVADTVLLNPGVYQMKLQYTGGTGDFFNINWIDMEYLTIAVPGRLEAENYNDSLGITSGPSGDADGTKALGHISNGDWTTYEINVAQKNLYTLTYRVASGSNGGNINMIVNNTQVRSTAVKGTGGWGTFTTVTDTVLLNQGIQTLKLSYTGSTTTDLLNLNWVDIKPLVITVTAASATSFCDGGSVVLSTAKTNGYTYQWYTNTTLLSGATNASYSASAAGAYKVAVTYGGVTLTSAATTVTVYPKPAAAITSPSTHFCTGGSLLLTANSGAGLSYQWSNASGTIAGATAGTYSATAAGSYTVKVTNATNCSTVSTALAVTVDAMPTVSDAGPDQHITTASAALAANDALVGTGTWTVVYGKGVLLNASSANSQLIGITEDSTVLSWTITNGSCASSTSRVTIYKNTAPASQTIQGLTTVTPYQTDVTYSVTSNKGSWYHWKLPSGASITSSNADSTLIVVSFGNTSGDVSVTETNAFGSTTSTLPVDVHGITTGITVSSSANYDVKPNPFTESISVHIKSVSGESVRILITDLSGRIAGDYIISAAGEYVVGEDLDAGMYVLTIFNSNISNTYKIIKN